jgi:hypothetical protein
VPHLGALGFDASIVRVPPGEPPSTFNALALCEAARLRNVRNTAARTRSAADGVEPLHVLAGRTGPISDALNAAVRRARSQHYGEGDGGRTLGRPLEPDGDLEDLAEKVKKLPRHPPKPPYEPKDEQPAASKISLPKSDEWYRQLIKLASQMVEQEARCMLAHRTQEVWSKMGKAARRQTCGAGSRKPSGIGDPPKLSRKSAV